MSPGDHSIMKVHFR